VGQGLSILYYYDLLLPPDPPKLNTSILATAITSGIVNQWSEIDTCQLCIPVCE